MLTKKTFSILLSLLFMMILTACGGGVSTQPVSSTGGTGTGETALSWTAPTSNTDGTPLTDLAGYKIYYGDSSRNYTNVIDVGNMITYTIHNLAPGTHYFTVTTYNTVGSESAYSNEVAKATT